jgi:hypothetical protein
LTVEVVGDRRPKLHVPRAAKHQFTLIRIVVRLRARRGAEYKPHLTSVIGIGAALNDASIHHDNSADLKPLRRAGGARLYVPRAHHGQLAPTRANANQDTDGFRRVRPTDHDLAVQDDDASRVEPLDPQYVLGHKPWSSNVRPGPCRRSSGPIRRAVQKL